MNGLTTRDAVTRRYYSEKLPEDIARKSERLPVILLGNRVLHDDTEYKEDICNTTKLVQGRKSLRVRNKQMRTAYSRASAVNNMTWREFINCAAVSEVVLVSIFFLLVLLNCSCK